MNQRTTVKKASFWKEVEGTILKVSFTDGSHMLVELGVGRTVNELVTHLNAINETKEVLEVAKTQAETGRWVRLYKRPNWDYSLGPKPIDKSKKSNRRCVNCVHWKECSSYKDSPYKPKFRFGKYGERITPEKICPVAGGKEINYWNCCQHFEWDPEKPYTKD